MTPDCIFEFFKENSLLPPSIIIKIAEHFKYKTYEKKEFFLTEGIICNNLLILEKGYMRAFVTDENKNDITTDFFSRSQIVFEPESYFNKTNAKENIQALTDCEGWSINYRKMHLLFHSIPELHNLDCILMLKKYIELKTRMILSLTRTAEEQYSLFILSNPGIVQNVTLKYIASYLGITDSSLSRIRKETVKVSL